MKRYTPHLILALAFLIAGFALFGNDSYSQLKVLQTTLVKEKKQADQLEEKIQGLRNEVAGLQTDDRVLEKAARNELALAKENEVIVFFDEPESAREIRAEMKESSRVR